MQYGIVKGSVVATQKLKDLSGFSLKVVLPCDEQRNQTSEAIIAIDPIGARTEDLIMWVGKREASLAIPGAPLVNNYPVDAAITGIIDDIS
ncbi:MAG: hypothetical protein A3K03_11275 [Bdellovibrionales bacterium RIFOXYD1_FULL_44_7]|nr:MAG: hypothetical protein A3K03_11275 [Bdellovibrionales bacterium RIFOXYD1_FULL_44_7]